MHSACKGYGIEYGSSFGTFMATEEKEFLLEMEI